MVMLKIVYILLNLNKLKYMYKVSEEILNKFKNAMKLTSSMLDVAYKGGKLHPDEVDKVLKNNLKLIQLIEDNFNGK